MSSGADLARGALAAARAAARQRPAGPAKPRRNFTAVKSGTGRDPVGLGATLGAIAAANGWDTQQRAGSIVDQWPDLVPPELAGLVTPEHFDPERRILHLRPATAAAASMLRLLGRGLPGTLNGKLGGNVVAGIKVLPVGAGGNRAHSGEAWGGDFTAVKPGTGRGREFSAENPAPGWPGPTGAPPSAELQEWRDTYRRERATRDTSVQPSSSPWFEGAYGRLREPETVHAATVGTPEDPDLRARSAAAHARALAAARAQRRPGDPTTLRPAAGAA